jgi:hypothetical protein
VRVRRTARSAAWLAAIALGAIQILMSPYRMSSEDVVSYLDIADAYRHHQWKAAINGYWSPLYSWVLALGEWLVRPPPAWEFWFVRLMNFVIYLGALAAFEFFLRQIIASHETAVLEGHPAKPLLRIPRWIWWLGGYSLFLWASLTWIGLCTDTPDLCASALILMASGFIARRARAPLSRRVSLVVGLLTGMAYLAKTAMFPLGFVFAAAAGGGKAGRGIGRSAWVLFGFAIVALPFIVSLSLIKHRLTIGESGRMNYVWNVNPGRYVVPGLHWQGGPRGSGAPVHPTRQIWIYPAAFEFAHGNETFPPWNDPSYWYEGLQVHVSTAAQLKVAASNAGFYGRMFLLPVAALYAMLLCLGAFRQSVAGALHDNWRLLLVSATGLLAYLLATDLVVSDIRTQPSSRYVAVFVVILFAAMVSGIRLPYSDKSQRAVASLTLLGVVLTGVHFTVWSDLSLRAVGRPLPADQLVAVGVVMRGMGIGPGSRVAIIGRKVEHVFWARLARVKIVCQVPDADGFLNSDPAVQEELATALARAGADALVSWEWVADHSRLPWQRVGASSYYALDLATLRLK